MTNSEVFSAIEEYSNGIDKLLETARRWQSDSSQCLDAAKAVDGDFYQRIQVAQDLLSKWEIQWSLQT